MTTAVQNKATVLEAFDTLFNKRDYEKAASFWSPNYIQHSAHIPPGRDGLFNLVRALPDKKSHDPRRRGLRDRPRALLRPRSSRGLDRRFEHGKLAEHWDVLQDEATQADSVSGLPMFGDRFPPE
jgi:predicted SnoaL-like aldol condensation-catalyzing enzyme